MLVYANTKRNCSTVLICHTLRCLPKFNQMVINHLCRVHFLTHLEPTSQCSWPGTESKWSFMTVWPGIIQNTDCPSSAGEKVTAHYCYLKSFNTPHSSSSKTWNCDGQCFLKLINHQSAPFFICHIKCKYLSTLLCCTSRPPFLPHPLTVDSFAVLPSFTTPLWMHRFRKKKTLWDLQAGVKTRRRDEERRRKR